MFTRWLGRSDSPFRLSALTWRTSPPLVSCTGLQSQSHDTNRSKFLLLRTFLWSLIFYHLSAKHAVCHTLQCSYSSTVVRMFGAFYRCSPIFKTTKPFRNWVQLMEFSPKAILSISYVSVQVSCRFWQNLMHTHCSVFSVVRSATATQRFQLFIWGRMRLRIARVWTGRDMPEHASKTPCPWISLHIGEITPVCIRFEQPSHL